MNDTLELSDIPTMIQVLRLQPGDVLVVQADRYINEHVAAGIKDRVRAIFGRDIPVMVLSDGMSLSVVRPE